MQKPGIKVGDWIRIGQTDCIVSNIYSDDYDFADCEVVFNPMKPSNNDVKWDGSSWQFVGTAGYADRYSRLSDAVAQLKRGRWE